MAYRSKTVAGLDLSPDERILTFTQLQINYIKLQMNHLIICFCLCVEQGWDYRALCSYCLNSYEWTNSYVAIHLFFQFTLSDLFAPHVNLWKHVLPLIFPVFWILHAHNVIFIVLSSFFEFDPNKFSYSDTKYFLFCLYLTYYWFTTSFTTTIVLVCAEHFKGVHDGWRNRIYCSFSVSLFSHLIS